eukprot:gene33719-38957_t
MPPRSAPIGMGGLTPTQREMTSPDQTALQVLWLPCKIITVSENGLNVMWEDGTTTRNLRPDQVRVQPGEVLVHCIKEYGMVFDDNMILTHCTPGSIGAGSAECAGCVGMQLAKVGDVD